MCEKCYVSTPIYYASGKIQIGNSYTTVACDTYARYNRQMGRKTFFLTGMDEHGQKIEEAAKKANIEPQKFVDNVAEETKALWKTMHIDYDYFVRTTDKNHEKVVSDIFERMLKTVNPNTQSAYYTLLNGNNQEDWINDYFEYCKADLNRQINLDLH